MSGSKPPIGKGCSGQRRFANSPGPSRMFTRLTCPASCPDRLQPTLIGFSFRWASECPPSRYSLAKPQNRPPRHSLAVDRIPPSASSTCGSLPRSWSRARTARLNSVARRSPARSGPVRRRGRARLVINDRRFRRTVGLRRRLDSAPAFLRHPLGVRGPGLCECLAGLLPQRQPPLPGTLWLEPPAWIRGRSIAQRRDVDPDDGSLLQIEIRRRNLGERGQQRRELRLVTDDGHSFHLLGAGRDRLAYRFDVELRIELRENGHLAMVGRTGENLRRLHCAYQGARQDQVQPAAELGERPGHLLEPPPAFVRERSPIIGDSFAHFARDAVSHDIELHDVSCLRRKALGLAAVFRDGQLASAKLRGFRRSLQRIVEQALLEAGQDVGLPLAPEQLESGLDRMTQPVPERVRHALHLLLARPAREPDLSLARRFSLRHPEPWP